jgi:predicted Kef-type K+ transport protein
MLDPVIILVALGAGLLFKRVGFPPMLGYLASGFILYSMGLTASEGIKTLADLGITLLLFSIGLKLNIRDMGSVRLWGITGVHMAVSIACLGGFLMLLVPYLAALQGLDSSAIWTIAFALSFSSTVLAVKVFEEQGESAALHAKIAIGILIIQDLVAVVFMASSTGKVPDVSALLLLLLIPCRPLLHRLLKACGHGELMVLFGFAMAIGGAALFEYFYVKGDLGALVVGILLGGSLKSNELAKSLLNLKDLFLVGFFLTIGLSGFPSIELMTVAFILSVIIVYKPFLYYWLMTLMALRARTSLLAALALFNYSEFGLIVAGVAAQQGLLPMEWVTTIAVALAFSFFMSVPINARAIKLYNNYKRIFTRFERVHRLPGEEPVDLGNARIIVLGMGRVGSGVYEYLERLYPEQVAGIEENNEKLIGKYKQGLNVFRGDASDRDFWDGIDLHELDLVMISLTNHAENVAVVELIRELGYSGKLAVIARFADEMHELEALGCISYNFYAEAGHGFAEHVYENIKVQPEAS